MAWMMRREMERHSPSCVISFLLQQSYICFTMLAGTVPECITLHHHSHIHGNSET